MSKSPAKPKKLSPGEEMFAQHCAALVSKSLRPEREFKFHPDREWRFDFAFPRQKLAVEIEGGIWTVGAHTRGKHFESDCKKYNAAVLLGWRVLRYSTGMVESGQAIDDVLAALR